MYKDVMQCETRILWHKDTTLQDLTTEDCIMIPGGFSYGDYLRCGAMAVFAHNGIGDSTKQRWLCMGRVQRFSSVLC